MGIQGGKILFSWSALMGDDNRFCFIKCLYGIEMFPKALVIKDYSCLRINRRIKINPQKDRFSRNINIR
jgi:hypothetical protein